MIYHADELGGKESCTTLQLLAFLVSGSGEESIVDLQHRKAVTTLDILFRRKLVCE